MAILNFAPLLIWALGLLWLNNISTKWMAMHFNWTEEKLKEYNDKHGEAFAGIWWIGVIAFLIIGLISAAKEA